MVDKKMVDGEQTMNPYEIPSRPCSFSDNLNDATLLRKIFHDESGGIFYRLYGDHKVLEVGFWNEYNNSVVIMGLKNGKPDMNQYVRFETYHEASA